MITVRVAHGVILMVMTKVNGIMSPALLKIAPPLGIASRAKIKA
jgi:hypothetical protein